jgi:ComF family protein
MNTLTNLFILVRGLVFPQTCGLCGDSLYSVNEMHYGICEECKAAIVPVQGPWCKLCGIPLVSEHDFCLLCRNEKQRSYDRLWVLFPYIGKYRKLLSAYKFGKNLNLANLFTEKLMEIINREIYLHDAVIVPVPPRPGKLKKNGWDQTDYLTKKLLTASKKKLTLMHCLKRRKSKIQKNLDRTERMENMKGRIYLHGTAPKTALIIDDVITTGSTIEVCSKVLRESGTEKVYVLCLFYD